MTKVAIHTSIPCFYHIVSAGYPRIDSSLEKLDIMRGSQDEARFRHLCEYITRKRAALKGQQAPYVTTYHITLDDIDNAYDMWVITHRVMHDSNYV